MKRLNAATIAQTVSAIDSGDMCPLYPAGSSRETSGAKGFVLVAVDSIGRQPLPTTRRGVTGRAVRGRVTVALVEGTHAVVVGRLYARLNAHDAAATAGAYALNERPAAYGSVTASRPTPNAAATSAPQAAPSATRRSTRS